MNYRNDKWDHFRVNARVSVGILLGLSCKYRLCSSIFVGQEILRHFLLEVEREYLDTRQAFSFL